MTVIDKARTWKLVEERLAVETDPHKHRLLEVVLEHMLAEAAPDLARLMSTLGEHPDYHLWGPQGDHGPKGRAAVEKFYSDFVASGANHLEFDVDRLVVDNHAVITEGTMTMLYPGRLLTAMNIAVDEVDAYYLYRDRMLIIWPFDESGALIGEDSYTGQAGFVGIADRKVPNAELPPEIRK
jgi:hypothetical protein